MFQCSPRLLRQLSQFSNYEGEESPVEDKRQTVQRGTMRFEENTLTGPQRSQAQG